jgi:hypothetical protein
MIIEEENSTCSIEGIGFGNENIGFSSGIGSDSGHGGGYGIGSGYGHEFGCGSGDD